MTYGTGRNGHNWDRIRRQSAWQKYLGYGLILLFLTAISLPILIPYLWMFLLSLTSQFGDPQQIDIWQISAVLCTAIGVTYLLAYRAPQAKRRYWGLAGGIFTLALITGLLWDQLHLDNYRFLITRDLIAERQGASTVAGQFPSVWVAFSNSLILAIAQTLIVVMVSTLAGYYLSRFAFPARASFLQLLLVLQAFPAMTLIIPIFLLSYYVGLLNTLVAPMLVLTTLELPFFIFIMKGFFDAVPWDIEMSALVDGASRRQAFRQIILPQVRNGMLAIAIFAFIKGWEEYVFVSSLRTGDSYWVMSLYLYYVSEDVMGVDYGLVAAVSIFYLFPALVLYLFTQKYLTQMSVGGVKG